MAERLFSGLGRIFVLPDGLGPMRLQVLKTNILRHGGDLATRLDATISVVGVHESITNDKFDQMEMLCGGRADVRFVDVRWIFTCIREQKLSAPAVLRGPSMNLAISNLSPGF